MLGLSGLCNKLETQDLWVMFTSLMSVASRELIIFTPCVLFSFSSLGDASDTKSLPKIFFFFLKKAVNALEAVIAIAFTRADVETQVKCSANGL